MPQDLGKRRPSEIDSLRSVVPDLRAIAGIAPPSIAPLLTLRRHTPRVAGA